MRHTVLNTMLATTMLAAFAGITAPAALAAAPLAGTTAPGFQRFMLGADEVTALSDGTVDLPVDQLLKQSPDKTVRALHAAFLATPTETSVNAYLINTGSRLVLVDTGAGNLFGPTLGRLASNLQASGYRPEDVDDILLTHLHPDHVGGLAAGGARVFPNATIHVDKRETDYWLSKANLDAAPNDSKGFFQGAMASLAPYVDARRIATFSGDGEPVPGIKAIASHGHTVGHTSYLVESGGRQLLLVGDLIHVPAVQLAHPDVTIAFDSDAGAAAASRDAVFRKAVREGTLIGAAHIAYPGLGHLRAAGSGFEWVPVNYTRGAK
jgi:glyoxylase-like metal-dependent hydrolase (beta-lactamase superfamily II)